MIRKINLLLILSLISVVSFAQISLTDKYQKGEVVLLSGETVSGYIYLNFSRPQDFQHHVSIISEETYQRLAQRKPRLKEIKRFKSKEARYFKLADGRKFRSVDCFDFTKLGHSTVPHKCFLEELVAGSITLFKHYPEFEYQVTDQWKSLTDEQRWEYTQKNFDLLMLKGDQFPKSVISINVKELISDNTTVINKFEADHYGSLKTVFSAIVKFGEIQLTDHLDAFIDLVSDYNQKM